ncbi:hypothetical protein THASP1DRAFT_32829 [Thamnocephalis sphaerospora]|uniref:Uncharacterized protein n=1 Tax=Thamnocephalis sphaerospora TaxID=78915 RepID=A0A4V1IVV0_9FUNG|nr:hypothetical protein THASP1DRAFT_32829 [Thamnocephalis sphaerospora]|eukprot:RKP05329.1 hypothetical protein THASP1DRAFT_32829 [Thamnocephalis sphaerospora]
MYQDFPTLVLALAWNQALALALPELEMGLVPVPVLVLDLAPALMQIAQATGSVYAEKYNEDTRGERRHFDLRGG